MTRPALFFFALRPNLRADPRHGQRELLHTFSTAFPHHGDNHNM